VARHLLWGAMSYICVYLAEGTEIKETGEAATKVAWGLLSDDLNTESLDKIVRLQVQLGGRKLLLTVDDKHVADAESIAGAIRLGPCVVEASESNANGHAPRPGISIESVNSGVDLKQTLPTFPERRVCRDGGWAFLFVLVVALVFGAGVYYTPHVVTKVKGRAAARQEKPEIDDVGGRAAARQEKPEIGEAADVSWYQRSYHERKGGVTDVSFMTSKKGVDVNVVATDDKPDKTPSDPVLNPTARRDPFTKSVTVRRLEGEGSDSAPESRQGLSPLMSVITSTILAASAGLSIVGISFYALKTDPERVVPAALFAPPCLYFALTVICGIGSFFVGLGIGSSPANNVLLGFSISSFFLCLITTCMACVYYHLVPFTVSVVKCLMEVVSQHPALLMVAVLGMCLSTLWLVVCSVAFFGLRIHLEEREVSAHPSHHAILFFLALVAYWGSMVAMNVTVAAHAGVFGRWYFGKAGPMTMPSFKVALTTSLGSISLGSLIVAAIRALELLVKVARHDANDCMANMVMAIIACCIQCFLSCIGDFIEYFNAWAYIQCAIRNASFCQAAKITWSMCKLANADLIFADILTGYISSALALLSAFVGLGVGGAVGYAFFGGGLFMPRVVICALAAFVSALIGGSCFSEILGTGARTILVLWAEDPTPFATAHNELHCEFLEKVRGKLLIQPGQDTGCAELQDFSVSKPGEPDAKVPTHRY